MSVRVCACVKSVTVITWGSARQVFLLVPPGLRLVAFVRTEPSAWNTAASQPE